MSQDACEKVENNEANAEDNEELGAALGQSLALYIFALGHHVHIVVLPIRKVQPNVLLVLGLREGTVSQLCIEMVPHFQEIIEQVMEYNYLRMPLLRVGHGMLRQVSHY